MEPALPENQVDDPEPSSTTTLPPTNDTNGIFHGSGTNMGPDNDTTEVTTNQTAENANANANPTGTDGYSPFQTPNSNATNTSLDSNSSTNDLINALLGAIAAQTQAMTQNTGHNDQIAALTDQVAALQLQIANVNSNITTTAHHSSSSTSTQLLPSNKRPKKTNNSTFRMKANQPSFPVVLMAMLSATQNSQYITFLSNGDSFIIIDPVGLELNVLPKHFEDKNSPTYDEFLQLLAIW